MLFGNEGPELSQPDELAVRLEEAARKIMELGEKIPGDVLDYLDDAVTRVEQLADCEDVISTAKIVGGAAIKGIFKLTFGRLFG